MNRRKSPTGYNLRFGLITLCFWLGGIGAGVAGAASISPELACGAAGRAAEQHAVLPANLLISIGLVESGRIDPFSGRVAAWPWTVNVDGAGHFFTDQQDATAFAQESLDTGARDVDVGCFQISLENHPDAFPTLNAAFDPAGNADFAARFLGQLKAQSGSWDTAIADYHSAWPELGMPYQRRVLAAWQSLGGAPADSPAEPSMLPDLTVILLGPAARQVRVITMDGETGPPPGAWLPRVITP